MKWNQKSLRKNFSAWAKDLNIRDFEGDSAEDAVAFVKSLAEHYDIPGLVKNGEVDEAAVKSAWGRKTVRIVADAGEEVIVEDPAMAEEMDGEDEEIKETDEDELTKAYKQYRKALKNAGQTGTPHLKSVHDASQTRGGMTFGKIGDERSAKMKAYERAAKSGAPLRGTGKAAIFDNAEKAEAMGAAMRLTVMGAHPYAQKSMDEKIVTKAGSAFNPATGGALVFGEFSTEMIELFDQYGVARQAVGVTQMQSNQMTIPRMASDVTVYDVGENDAITPSDEGYDNVTLNATKTAALKRLPMELLKFAAIDVVDIVGRSMARAVGKWEDESYINGSHGRTGLDTLVATTGTDRFDSNSGGWASITISDVQSAIGLLPGWAHAEGVGIMCSSAFYSTVLDTFAFNAGGNSGNDLKTGFGGMTMWGQYPVFISESMPSSYSDGQNVMYIGAFKAASKFGLVSGSEAFATSDQRYFDQDQFAVRYTQLWDINLHDVGGSNSGVVALQA